MVWRKTIASISRYFNPENLMNAPIASVNIQRIVDGFMSLEAFAHPKSPKACLSQSATIVKVKQIVAVPKIAWVHIIGN